MFGEGIKPKPGRNWYRNKMEFTFGDAYQGGPIGLMHKHGNSDIVEVSQTARL